jgi:SET domain-containing protein
LGRSLNHSIKHANIKPRKEVDWTDQPRIIFVAVRDIAPKEELVFDYGDRENIKEFPWLSPVEMCLEASSDEKLISSEPKTPPRVPFSCSIVRF